MPGSNDYSMYDAQGSSFTPPTTPITTQGSQPVRSGGSGGTLFGAIAGGAFDLLNNWIASRREKKAREAQIQENQKNREWQEEMYNKYESPSAQAQQMRAAGFNPAPQGSVSSQSVGSASTASLPTSSLPGIGAGITAGVQTALAIKAQKLELRKQKEVELQNWRDNVLEHAKLAIEQGRAEDEHKVALEQLDALGLSNRQQKVQTEWLESVYNSGINPHEDAHNESTARTAISTAQANLISANEQYQRILNSHADDKEKAQIRSYYATAASQYAQALASSAQATYTEQLQKNATNEEARKAAKDVLETEILKLQKQGVIDENTARKMQNEFDRVVKMGNINNAGELGMYIWNNVTTVLQAVK